MQPDPYQHAIGSGVYLIGVDSSSLQGRKLVLPSQVGTDPVVFLVLGQSNIANHGESKFSATANVFNFNPFDGNCYFATDPLLGATGDLGSPLCVLGDKLIQSGFANSIVFCNLAVGGSTVREWAPGGPYHHRLTYGLSRLYEFGLTPSYVLWHQGEADAFYGTTAFDYSAAFRRLATSVRALKVFAPIFVARATYFAIPEGYEAKQQEVRRAQADLICPDELIFGGPDTDLIRDRYDGCHFSRNGLISHAQAWHEVLVTSGR